MAKKTSTKTKSAAKPVAKTPDVPVVVDNIRALATSLAGIADIPEPMSNGRTKLGEAIQRYADRVAKNIAGAGKKAEKEAKKVEREAKKVERDKAKAEKKAAKIKALKEQIAKLEKSDS